MEAQIMKTLILLFKKSLSGEKKTGVTIMVMDEQIDHGSILAQKTYDLQPITFYAQAEKELAELGAKLLVEILPKYINGEAQPREQNHGQATFTKMFSREDGRIDWNQPAEKIHAQIRALNPEPGTWSVWKDKMINIKKAVLANGKINIQTIQMEGGKEIPFKEFLLGHQDFDVSQLK
ncbi:MAG: hypothetical protein HYT66_00940 [Candidatus Yanofskybacteria bacterium]|nr:hypothetical protein [Candidatus Yanofskybacteria bacterium]